MRDEETGSWWQQVSGEAVFGPLKGKRLKLLQHDEITFKQWKSEQVNGRVLRPDPVILAAGKYAPPNWEDRMRTVPVVTPPDGMLEPRTLVAGIVLNGKSKAYPISAIETRNVIVDTVSDVPVVIVLAGDGKSLRAFDRRVEGRELEFYARKAGDGKSVLVDSQTGGEWDFTGLATSGELSGRRLTPVYVLKEYWFDWKTYHPETSVYRE